MNQYLLKLAGKLPTIIKGWVRKELKDSEPLVSVVQKGGGNKSLASVHNIASRMSRESAKKESPGTTWEHFDRSNAIIEKVLSYKFKPR